MPTREELAVLITGDNSSFRRALNDTESAVSRFDRIGKAAFIGLTAGVGAAAAGAGFAAKRFIDFESAFAGVRKTVDATEAEFAGLERGIRDMALRMPATASEIAGVAQAAGQLGVETPNILKFSETMIKLAVAAEGSGLTAQDAAIALARFTGITGLAQGDVDKLASSIVALGNNFAANEVEIINFATRIAGAGKIAGLADSQMVAIATAMSHVGIEAEAGGTAVQKVLIGMKRAVAEGGEQLETFARVAGIAADEFAEAFRRDAGAAFTMFVEGIKANGDEAFALMEDLGLQDQRLTRAFFSLSEAGSALRDTMEVSQDAFNANAAATKEFEDRLATTAAKIQMFKNRVSEAAISIGGPVIEALERMGQAFLEAFRGGDANVSMVETLKSVVRDVTPVLETMADVIGRVARFFRENATLSKVLFSLLVGLAGASVVLRAAMLAQAAAQLVVAATGAVMSIGLAPFLLIVLGLVAAITLIIVVWKNWDKVVEFSVGVWSTVKDALLGFWIALKDAFKTTIEWISSRFTTAVRFLEALPAALFALGVALFTRLWEGLQEAWAATWTWLTSIGIQVAAFFLGLGIDLYQTGVDILQGLWNGFKDTWTKIVKWFSDQWNAFRDKFKGFFGISSPSRLFKGFGENIVEGFAEGLRGMDGVVDLSFRAVERPRASAGGEARTARQTSVTVHIANQTIHIDGGDPDDVKRQMDKWWMDLQRTTGGLRG